MEDEGFIRTGKHAIKISPSGHSRSAYLNLQNLAWEQKKFKHECRHSFQIYKSNPNITPINLRDILRKRRS